MLRRTLVLMVASVATAPTVIQASAPESASAGAPTAASPAVVVPPDLQALEQKMLALRLTSERFSASLSVSETSVVRGPAGGFGHIFGRTSSLTVALLSASGEVSFVPQAANIQVSFLGVKINARLIGSTLYIEEPFLARLDGGRPWVEERKQTLGGALGMLGPSTPGGDATGGAGRLVETFNGAHSIREIGPATVDGQPTTAFKASIELARLGTLTSGQKRDLGKVVKPLASIELFIAEDGLPVRTRVVLGVRRHRGELITQSDVLAVNVPVVVQAPPADKTISQTRLTRLLTRRPIRQVSKGRSHVDPEEK